MNGPGHYREAELLLAEVTASDGSVSFGDGGEACVAAAQVHATLALAAATALNDPMPPIEVNEWAKVAGSDRMQGVDQ